MSAVIVPTTDTDAADELLYLTEAVEEAKAALDALLDLEWQRSGTAKDDMRAYFARRIKQKRAILMLAYAEVMDITGVE